MKRRIFSLLNSLSLCFLNFSDSWCFSVFFLLSHSPFFLPFRLDVSRVMWRYDDRENRMYPRRKSFFKTDLPKYTVGRDEDNGRWEAAAAVGKEVGRRDERIEWWSTWKEEYFFFPRRDLLSFRSLMPPAAPPIPSSSSSWRCTFPVSFLFCRRWEKWIILLECSPRLILASSVVDGTEEMIWTERREESFGRMSGAKVEQNWWE